MDLVFDYTTTAAQASGPGPSAEARRLWELTAAYQQFVGHELANQLVPLQAFARLLLEHHGNQLDEDGRHLLGRMADLTQRADRHARQLAEVGRLLREPAWGPALYA